MPALRKIT